MRWLHTAMILAILIGPIVYIAFPSNGFAQNTPSESDQPIPNTIQESESESGVATSSQSQPNAVAVPQGNVANPTQLDIDPQVPPEEGAVTPAQTQPASNGISATGTGSGDLQFWLIFAVSALSITTTVAVAISFYLYYWRRILLAQPNTTVPEDWARFLQQVGQRLTKLDNLMTRELHQLNHNGSATRRQVSDMVETFLTLHTHLDERDAEIRRLKKGYDAQVFRKFLYRFIRVHLELCAILEAEEISEDDMKTIKALMEDALDECDVQPFKPPLQVDWRRQEGIADSPTVIETEDADQAFRIAEVVEPGYRLGRDENAEVIVPAKVRIFALR